MNACLFEEAVATGVVLGGGGSIAPRREKVRLCIPKLYVTEIPSGVDSREVRETLVHASSQVLNAPVDWDKHRVELEDDWPREVVATWQQGRVKKVSWEYFVEETRRITIRLNPRLFAVVENEARLRACSLNQFCVDALSAQVRTRSKRLERLILEDALSNDEPEGRPTSLPEILTRVTSSLADCRHAELVDAIKRLAHMQYLIPRKWNQNHGFVPYGPDGGGDADFFYRGDFRLKITEKGRPYLDGLRSVP